MPLNSLGEVGMGDLSVCLLPRAQKYHAACLPWTLVYCVVFTATSQPA